MSITSNNVTAQTEAKGKNEVFDNLAHTVATMTSKDPKLVEWVEQNAHKDRLVDVTAFTALAQSARVHLTENGSMLFSFTLDGKVYNHQMTEQERQKLNATLTNDTLSRPEQIKGIASVFSKISINQNVANHFDNDMTVDRNVRNSFHL